MNTFARAGGSHFLDTENALSLQLEQRLVRGQADIVHALRVRASQTGSLASSHQDQTNLASADGIQRNASVRSLLILAQLLHIRNLAKNRFKLSTLSIGSSVLSLLDSVV